MTRRLRRMLARFRDAQRGVALVEFAIVLPVILLVLLGAMEITRGIIITQRVEKAGYVIADITSQYPPATGERLSAEISLANLQREVFPQFSVIMGIHAQPSRQAVILTSVRREGGMKLIKWQAAGGGSLSAGVHSVVNGAAPSGISAEKDQPTGFSGAVEAELAGMPDGENMIVAEVFYFYEPIWTRLVNAIPREGGEHYVIATPKLIVKRMFFRPRNGDLTCLPDGFIYAECIPEPEEEDPPPGSCNIPDAACDTPAQAGMFCCVGVRGIINETPCTKECLWLPSADDCPGDPCDP